MDKTPLVTNADNVTQDGQLPKRIVRDDCLVSNTHRSCRARWGIGRYCRERHSESSAQALDADNQLHLLGNWCPIELDHLSALFPPFDGAQADEEGGDRDVTFAGWATWARRLRVS